MFAQSTFQATSIRKGHRSDLCMPIGNFSPVSGWAASSPRQRSACCWSPNCSSDKWGVRGRPPHFTTSSFTKLSGKDSAEKVSDYIKLQSTHGFTRVIANYFILGQMGLFKLGIQSWSELSLPTRSGQEQNFSVVSQKQAHILESIDLQMGISGHG